MLSPGITHDIDLTVEHVPTTPRQIISSLPATPRRLTDNVFGGTPWDITNPLHELYVLQVDDERIFARWRHEFRITTQSAWRHLSNPAWLRENVLSERTYVLIPELEAIGLCRDIIYICLCISSFRAVLQGSGWSDDIDMIIYFCHNPHTQTVSVRFTAQGTKAKDLQNRAMGFELVTSSAVQTFKFAQWEPWMHGLGTGLYTLLKGSLVIADRFGLQPFTWPSSDDDVERAQLLKSRFGHGAATNSLF